MSIKLVVLVAITSTMSTTLIQEPQSATEPALVSMPESSAIEREKAMKQQLLQAELTAAESDVAHQRLSKDPSVSLAVSIRKFGEVRRKMGKLPEALQNFEESLAMLHRCGLYNSPEVGEALFCKGAALYEIAVGAPRASTLENQAVLANRCKVADESLEQALKIRQRLNPDSPSVVECLMEHGKCLFWSEGMKASAKIFSSALSIQQLNEPISPASAICHAWLGYIAGLLKRRDPGNPDKAQAIEEQLQYQACVQVAKKLTPSTWTQEMGGAALALGDFFEGAQAYTASKPCFEFSRRIFIALRSPGDVAACAGRIGFAYFRENRLDLADRYCFEALKYYPRDNGDVAIVENNLGLIAEQRGDLSGAEHYFRVASDGFAKARHDQAVTGILNLGRILCLQEKFSQAEPYLRNAVDLTRTYKANDRDRISSRMYLGLALAGVGKYREGRPLVVEALETSRTFKMQDDLAAAENNLGTIDYTHHDLVDAAKEFNAALVDLTRADPKSTYIVGIESNLSLIAFLRGELDECARLESKVLAEYELKQPGSLLCAETNCSLGSVEGKRGNLARARELMAKGLRALSAYASTHADDSETGSRLQSVLGRVLADSTTEDDSEIYALRESLRGIELTLQARTRSLEYLARNDPVIKGLANAEHAAAATAATFAKNGPGVGRIQEFNSRLVQLNEARTEAFRTLSLQLIKRDPRLSVPESLSLDSINSYLPANTALIEFSRIEGWKKGNTFNVDEAYGAYVLRRNTRPRWVKLGIANRIDTDIKRFQELMGMLDYERPTPKDDQDLRRVSRELYDLLIRPLGELPSNLLIAPDSALHELPFNALVDRRGRFLIESKTSSIIGSVRDMISRAGPERSSPALVIAGPQFDSLPKESRQKSMPAEGTVLLRSSALLGPWKLLPGAMLEGRSVARVLGVHPLLGAEATEDRLLKASNPRILHIATHGFYLPAPKPENLEPLLASRVTVDPLRIADSPMLRSGLVLAGANRAPDLRRAGRLDGRATALELSQLDLRGTQLVVLSGCCTGLGDYRLGLGVFGLQRAFRFAGAQTLIMSLFSVPDASTRRLFEKFYKVWQPGSGPGTKLGALRQAQLALLRNPKTQNPKNWAGFVLLGDR